MTLLALLPHPSTPCECIRGISVHVERRSGDLVHLSYGVEGQIEKLRVAAAGPCVRADGLWRHTCFEVFLRLPGSAAYAEFNFAPSGAWAAYRFDSYRCGMTAIDAMHPPAVICRQNPQRLEADIQFYLPAWMNRTLQAALSAVVETRDGQISYWALAHPDGKPDFHHADGFATDIHQTPSEGE